MDDLQIGDVVVYTDNDMRRLDKIFMGYTDSGAVKLVDVVYADSFQITKVSR